MCTIRVQEKFFLEGCQVVVVQLGLWLLVALPSSGDDRVKNW